MMKIKENYIVKVQIVLCVHKISVLLSELLCFIDFFFLELVPIGL
jgi:hypothetical protein